MRERINFRFKIKAFTLLEIIVALILSFFILGILYLSYNMMGRHFQNEYQKQLSNLVFLRSGLEMDFFYADTIIADENQVHIFNDGKESIYLFQEDVILKEINLITDTLFKGEYLYEFETLKDKSWVKRIVLKVKVEKDELQLTCCKSYYPNQKLKSKEIGFEY